MGDRWKDSHANKQGFGVSSVPSIISMVSECSFSSFFSDFSSVVSVQLYPTFIDCKSGHSRLERPRCSYLIYKGVSLNCKKFLISISRFTKEGIVNVIR